VSNRAEEVEPAGGDHAEDRPALGGLGERCEVMVIGAGPAGLAVAAELRARGRSALVVERSESVGSSWRGHYDRLRLHTVRRLSGLPGLPIPRQEGRWVSRAGVVTYLERYARHHELDIRLGVTVQRLERAPAGWLVHTSVGTLNAGAVVVATGFNREPVVPDWPGRDGFSGELLHSAAYRNAGPYRGRQVLVVGTGNSGAEIAVDLAEGGAAPVALAARTPPNIQRRAVAGMPTQVLGIAMRRLPAPVVDRVSLAVQRLSIGDLSRYGLPRPSSGVSARAAEGRIPILDVGLVASLRAEQVRAVPAVHRFDGAEVVLVDGSRLRPDTVIAATGFRRGLEPLVAALGVLQPNGRPAVHGPQTHRAAPHLYFIGFSNPISGNLREIGIDARRIARAITSHRSRAAAAARRPPSSGPGSRRG
jgi:putative flavoprotein involved in K+ transport